MEHRSTKRVVRSFSILTAALGLAAAGCGSDTQTNSSSGNKPVLGTTRSAATGPASNLAFCRQPPGGLKPNQVPQLVSITFDDNFGIEDATGEGGIPWIMSAWKAHQNPSGGTLATFAGNSNNFNDADRLASFYVTTNYMAPDFD